MAPKDQFKDKVSFYLNSLDELGEVLINQEGSSGLTKGVLRIILGTMMASKGSVLGVKRTRCNILSSHGASLSPSTLRVNAEQKKALADFKNSNLNQSQIKKIFDPKSSNSLAVHFSDLSACILVPLFHKDNLLGIVALGKKFDGSSYRSLDKKILEIICNHLTDSLYNQELIENIKDKRMELRLKVLELQTLFDISLSLNSVLDIEELSSEVLIRSVSTLNASSGFILKTQKNSPILSVLSSFNVDEDQLKSAIFSKSSLPFKSVWKDKKSIIVSGDKSRSFLNKTNYKECII